MSPTETALAKIVADLGKLVAEQGEAQFKFAQFVLERLPTVPETERKALLESAKTQLEELRTFRQKAETLKAALK